MIHVPTPEQCAQIAMLNDQARRAMGILCRIAESIGVRKIPLYERHVIRALTQTFDFPKHSDNPYDEHDFGVVYQLASGRWTAVAPGDTSWLRAVFWSFEYSDKSHFAPSPAPWDGTQTERILNFMLPNEYGQDSF
jgi:Protein of unknown function (DUF3768)